MRELHASLINIYPNPFNVQPFIGIELDEDMPVTIEVFSIENRKVATILESNFKGSWHTIGWIGSDTSGQKLDSATNLCTLRSNSTIAIKKLIHYELAHKVYYICMNN